MGSRKKQISTLGCAFWAKRDSSRRKKGRRENETALCKRSHGDGKNDLMIDRVTEFPLGHFPDIVLGYFGKR